MCFALVPHNFWNPPLFRTVMSWLSRSRSCVFGHQKSCDSFLFVLCLLLKQNRCLFVCSTTFDTLRLSTRYVTIRKSPPMHHESESSLVHNSAPMRRMFYNSVSGSPLSKSEAVQPNIPRNRQRLRICQQKCYNKHDNEEN